MDPTSSQEADDNEQVTGFLGLNPDILATIIQYYLPDALEPVEIPPTLQSPYLTLCQICHPLRRLVLSSSRLWTRFAITSTKSGQHRDLVKEWLNRAANPISLENREESRFSMPELEEFVLPHSNRLYRLHLHITYEALEGLSAVTPPSTFPHLSDIRLQCNDTHQTSLLSVKPVFLGSPLEKFTLNLGAPFLVRGLGISWNRLKVLRLSVTQGRFFFPMSWIHAILDESQTSLETCSISLEPTTAPELPRLRLPYLKDLSIHFRDPGWKTQAGILGVLSLPSLISFALSSEDGLAFNEACPALKSFFQRSPSLQNLRFERTPAPNAGFNVRVNSSEVIHILTLVPNLKSVCLPQGHHTNIVAVLEAFLLKGVCPSIETMELMVNNGLQVVRVIQELWRESAGVQGRERTLQRVRLIDPKLSWIGICEPSPAEDPEITIGRKIIRELEGEGLMIST